MVDNVSADLLICVSMREGMGRDHQICLRVVQTVPHGRDTHCYVSCLVGDSAMPLDFRGQCDIVLLFYGPVYGGCVKLSAMEEEILSAVIGCMGSLLGSGVDRSQVDRAVPPVCHEKLGAGNHEVDTDKRGDMELPSRVGDEFEEPIPGVFKVAEPFRPW